ncbi:anti-sigma factor antagonist [Rhodococcoides trifolii]|uniref:Anti-sigma factor antagonist n=1 Tax=Rhodococcoides trifolii TaxID=908250 RepID=A0A917G3B2_9NOCA|nr:STAS domain-containing protein [Rhodococcus trifolii]GGG19729.1 anti-sigma factor antagonist [Rhodococcus trifolii]
MRDQPASKGFEVDVSDLDGVAVVSVRGSLDLASAPRLSETAYPAAEVASNGLVFDLTGVQFMSSSGVTVLVRTIDLLPDGASAAIVASQPAVQRPITLSGLDRVITTVPDVASAIEFVSPATPNR